jgi:hypothetical protein
LAGLVAGAGVAVSFPPVTGFFSPEVGVAYVVKVPPRPSLGAPGAAATFRIAEPSKILEPS